ncbi:MAG: hypothetical protein LBR55_03380 [Bacteroidales bacterium]|jgi:hypothetical protein|nr:hypothetical protein [Bacteroidales bacterium]
MKIFRKVTAISIVILLLSSCAIHYERAFLIKYEFEDFSQFNNTHIFIRGGDGKRNPIIMINAPNLVDDTSRVGLYVITLDKKNYQVIEAKWMTEYYVDADTIQLQQLAQRFMQYEIPRLDVDEQGNVFVYLADVETLAMVRFANENELQKRSKETKWKNIKSNWYKPK